MIHMIIQERGGIAKIYIFNNQIIITITCIPCFIYLLNKYLYFTYIHLNNNKLIKRMSKIHINLGFWDKK